MAIGDGIRRNIAHVEPSERALLRDALIELNRRKFPGTRTESPRGGVSFWFKQDEIHQATHVHGGPEFIPWHREMVNQLEDLLRQINPQLSLHYWDWTQDPRAIPNANLGGGRTGTLNLFTPDFMGFGGSSPAPIGEPWLSAGYYVPGAVNFRGDEGDSVNNNPADPPHSVDRSVGQLGTAPESAANDNTIINRTDYAAMRSRIDGLEAAHNRAHGFVNMGSQHTSFRDPFVFLLHSNVDRLFARWQTDPAHPERLVPATVYGSESNLDVLVNGRVQNLNHNIEPWSGEPPTTRPWAPPENEQIVKNYKHPSVVAPPRYDTNVFDLVAIRSVQFPNAFLRMDGTGVTRSTPPGGGTVNCQFGVPRSFEKFRLVPQSDGTLAIGSVRFQNVFLRLDGTGVRQPTAPGAGTVNCQFGVGGFVPVTPFEKFNLVPQGDGTVAIGSVAFPNVFLRMDGSSATQFTERGSGVVNCQFGAQGFEKFRLVATSL